MNSNCKSCRAADNTMLLSGPHLCANVGQHVLHVAKNALEDACDRSNGAVSRDEIDVLFEFLAKMPEMFAVYTHTFEVCRSIHETQAFASFGPPFFARHIIRYYCHDVVAEVFKSQIDTGGSKWFGYFLDGLVAHVETNVDPQFVSNLFECYRRLAINNGATLSISTVLGDSELQSILAKPLYVLNSESDRHHALENVINQHIAVGLNLSGPSQAKVNDIKMRKFFLGLGFHQHQNQFRRAVNKCVVKHLPKR